MRGPEDVGIAGGGRMDSNQAFAYLQLSAFIRVIRVKKLFKKHSFPKDAPC